MTKPTALLVLADGTVWPGKGIGSVGSAVGEVCFNTAMSGYQEILTDPSYAAQIVTFTFPHIGNVGANLEDDEATTPAARGVVLRADITEPANYRSVHHLDHWLKSRRIVGITGLDTRALTARIRDKGMPNAVIAHDVGGEFDLEALKREAAGWPGLVGMDLALEVSCRQAYKWSDGLWRWDGASTSGSRRFRVVAVDYGAKRNILRHLVDLGADLTVVPATATGEEILAHEPDGVFLSNGPGDPAATGRYAIPAIQTVLGQEIPLFGICLGHQLLALSVGGETRKMAHGHHGANHPVKDLRTGRVEITSMNHGFTVDAGSLPKTALETHVSLFDGTNCGLELTDRSAFSVQYHPEASPGPHDSHYLFARFAAAIEAKQAKIKG